MYIFLHHAGHGDPSYDEASSIAGQFQTSARMDFPLEKRIEFPIADENLPHISEHVASAMERGMNLAIEYPCLKGMDF